MKEKIKEVLDWLLEAFIWLYEIFLYSLILPLGLGFLMLVPIILESFAHRLSDLALKHVFIYMSLSVIVGLLIRNWRNNYLKSSRKQSSVPDKYNND